jgi:TRAP-type C4-dicarboxylate transport system substrate-binding protein
MTSQKSDTITLVLLPILLLVVSFWGVINPALAASSQAQKPILMRMAHYQPEQRVLMTGAKWWADQVQKRTGDRIIIKHYFSEELARAKEILPLVGQGGVDLGTPALTYHVSEFPLMQLLIDYPWKDLDALFWFVPRLVEQVPALQAEWTKNNVKPLSYGGLPPYGIVSIKPVKTLDDLKGLRIRVWGSTLPKRMQNLGMVPVTIPSSETYEAMAKGSVECTLSPTDQHKVGLWEVAKYHLKGEFIPALYAAQPIMNLRLFNSLDPGLRKIIMDLQVDHLKKLKELIVETDAADEKFLRDKGVSFPSLSEAENKRIEKDAIVLWEQAATQMKAQDNVKAVKAALVRLQAEYIKTR